MMPMPAALQMQLLQQQMMHGGGMDSYDGFDDDMYDMIDPRLLFCMYGYGQGSANGRVLGFDEATQYHHMLQQLQMMQQMQMMGYHGNGHIMRSPRRRAMKQMRILGGGMGMGMGVRGMIGGGVGGYAGFGGGGRHMMGSSFGMDPMRGNQLALMGSPWGGG